MSLLNYDDHIEALSNNVFELQKLNRHCKTFLSSEEVKDIEQISKKIEVSVDKIRYLRSLIGERSRMFRQETYWSIAAILSILVAIPIWYIYTPNPTNTLSNVIVFCSVAFLTIVSGILFQRFIYNQTARDSLNRILNFEVIELGALTDFNVTIKGFSIYGLSVKEVALHKLFKLEKWFIVETLECCALCSALEARNNDLEVKEVSNKLAEHAPSTKSGRVEIPFEIELQRELRYTYV